MARRFKLDDVWSELYLSHVIFQSERPVELEDEAKAFLLSLGTSTIHVLLDEEDDPIPEGPYFLASGQIHFAYRLYPDTHGAFMVATVESTQPLRYVRSK